MLREHMEVSMAMEDSFDQHYDSAYLINNCDIGHDIGRIILITEVLLSVVS